MTRVIEDWDGKKTIQAKKIDKNKQRYFKKLRLSPSAVLDLTSANDFFLLVIQDFRTGSLSIDKLASFGFFLFHAVAKNHPRSDLFEATLAASELSFAIRTPAVYRNIEGYLADIDWFYDAHTKH